MAKVVECPTCGSDITLPERDDPRPAWCDSCGRELKATDLLGGGRRSSSNDDEYDRDDEESARRPGLNPMVTVVVVIGGLMLFTCLSIGGVAMLAIAALPEEEEVAQDANAVVVQPPMGNPPVFNPPKVNPPPPVAFQPPKPVEFQPVFPKPPTTIASTPPRPPVMTRPTLPRPIPPDPPKPIESKLIGSAIGERFRESAPGSAVLVGFDAAIGADQFGERIAALRAIYQSGNQITLGEYHGVDTGWMRIVSVRAKPGYAVGGLEGMKVLGIVSLSVVFQKVISDKLSMTDTYTSSILSIPKHQSRMDRISSEGQVPVGIMGYTRNSETSLAISIGLLFTRDQGTVPKEVPDRPRETPLVGFPVIKDTIQVEVPAGATLTGFEFGLSTFLRKPVVRMIQPIFTKDGQVVSGTPIGKTTPKSERITAKPGYAVGGMKVRRGFAADAIAVIFLHVRPDGTLDPADSYESDWIGIPTTANLTEFTLGSDGRPIYAMNGGLKNEEMTAIGFLFGTQTDPAVKK